MEKRIVRDRAGSFNIWDYDGLSVSEIIEEFKKLPQEAKLDVIRDCYSDDSELYIEREETEEEMNQRQLRESKIQRDTEEKERILLEDLKKKYEK